jgi:hypothetical protein
VLHRGPAEVPWAALEGQLARLGADGHLASVAWQPDHSAWPPPPPALSGRAVLLFVSPVHPHDLAAISINGRAVEILAVAAGRAVAIGGWQLRHDGSRQVGPRRLRRYHPSGTVACVRADGDLACLHATSVARDPEEQAAGFGFCVVGAWPRDEE